MKKIFVLSMLFVAGLFATELQAQELKLGAKAGVNLSDLKGPSSTDMKTSYHIGLFVEYFLNNDFAIQPEVIYSSQGAKESYEGMKTTGTFDYLHVPIMAKYYFGGGEGYYLQAGPQFGFLTKAETKYKGFGESMTVDIKDHMKSFEVGINVGLGYALENGVFFDARYNFGISKINKLSEAGSSDVKNRNIQLAVGYKF